MKSKKIIAFLLALVLLYSLNVSAFAKWTKCPNCQDITNPFESIDGVYYSISDTQHKTLCREQFDCEYCGRNSGEAVYKPSSHIINMVDAICNGVKQTHYFECALCNYKYEKEYNCPDKDHSDGCGMLPMNIDDRHEIY